MMVAGLDTPAERRRLRRLIRKGYFPAQLPPGFRTNDLARSALALLDDLPSELKGIIATSCERFSLARIGYQRRTISIPNPICQLQLAAEISRHWTDIRRVYRKSKLSATGLTFAQAASDRAVVLSDFRSLRELRLTSSSTYRYILVTDISRFFPTLYTHAIAWAAHTKKQAKANRNKFSHEYWGNRLDKILRRCNADQTLGIPIGPDSSHIIAEMLGVSVDCEIKERLGNWPPGYRHVDDFFLCFDTRSAAEEALNAIVQALKIYELEINPNKTRIYSISEYKEDDWTLQLQLADVTRDPDKMERQRSEIIQFFEAALSLAEKREDESVIRYALRRSESFFIFEENWEIFFHYVIKIGLLHQNNMQTLCEILVTYRDLDYHIDLAAVKRVCEAVINENAELEHHSEVAWSLWLAKEFQIRLSAECARKLSNIHSSVCALIALDLQYSGLLEHNLDLSYWLEQTKSSALSGDLWLLSYESYVKGWLRPKERQYVDRHPSFRLLNARSVSFYDPHIGISGFIRRVRLEETERTEFHFEYDEYGFDWDEDLEIYVS